MTSRIILGVTVHSITESEAVGCAQTFLSEKKHHTIFTPNPEMLVEAEKDHLFLDVLNRGTLNICDGFGLQMASVIVNPNQEPRLHRIHGIDFMLDICRIAADMNKSVYLLGSEGKETLVHAKDTLQKKFPTLRIAGTHPGLLISVRRDPESSIVLSVDENDALIDDIIDAAPDILFVGFGHHKQERWIDQYVKQLPSVLIAMGVGGSIDVLGGKLRRAPRFMRKLGFEWLWRLFLQPWRLKRIWNAVIVFPYLVLFKDKK